MLIRKIKIGNKNIFPNIISAPMAGYTNKAFRKIIRKYGNIKLCYSEMISARGICEYNEKTINMLKENNDNPIAIQLFGNNEEYFAKAVEILHRYVNPFLIDINAGCPVRKVIKNGGGSFLMRNPEKIYKIIKKVKEASNTPVSVKIRSGFDKDNINYIECGIYAQKAGASMVIIHPRTTKQMFSGISNWSHIAQLKQALKIPVIGNGDILSIEDIFNMLKDTKCDGVMIGRGLLKDPTIPYRAVLKEKHNINYKIRYLDILNIIVEHIKELIKLKGYEKGIIEFRKHIGFYIRGIKNASNIRKRIIQCTNLKNILYILYENKIEENM